MFLSFLNWFKSKSGKQTLPQMLGTMSALVISLEEHAAAAAWKIDFHNAEVLHHNAEFEQAARVAMKVKDLIS